jgi:rhamnose utilization protein RhaD (predicted bifunctional aldolase and dehydrogenase)/NAD(P)-dependent dehydrogenase (short-subunit alcohol dehydrogenase family)
MRSRWSAKDAKTAIAAGGLSKDLALRIYTTRLLGSDRALVLHGGGNTSVKTVMKDTLGDRVDVLCVKGSGWDMATIEAPGLPAVRLKPLARARELDAMSDEDMVNFLRGNLLDSAAPNPSVETLLHGFLPHKFVDHTHSTAVLSLVDQPNGEQLVRQVYGADMAFVPFIMPGFELAKKAAEIYQRDTAVQGLILHKHGIFTFGETAREAYERMIQMVSRAEQRLEQKRKSAFSPRRLPGRLATVADCAPLIRAACATAIGDAQPARWIVTHRANDDIMAYVNGRKLASYSQRGVVTPDHIIRTKNTPLLLPPPERGKLEKFAKAARDALAGYITAYDAYFAQNNARQKPPKTKLDPIPRVVLVPGLGLFTLGQTANDADIAADLAENTIDVITDAEAIGRYEPLAEAELFDMEYWSLEQAKLKSKKPKPFSGRVVLITGGGGTIGRATARAFAAQGAEIVLVDLDGKAAQAAAEDVGGIEFSVDVTDAEAVAKIFDACAARFGGVDIVVSNAGAAWQGKIGEVPDEVLRQSFELNFFAHQTVAKCAVRIMQAQGTGGVLLFNVSKQAVNPGADFGPYGLPKAATMFLVRQYALDYGAAGIRSNGVNADRIESGLLNRDMIAQRAKARGLTRDQYLSGNLLKHPVLADDVADAFVALAGAEKTTGHIQSVDGGNMAAALR